MTEPARHPHRPIKRTVVGTDSDLKWVYTTVVLSNGKSEHFALTIDQAQELKQQLADAVSQLCPE